MTSLLNLYFEHVNLFAPLLHRPTFGKGIASKLHTKNASFGGVVLLVCALGARLSDDPRVLEDGTQSTLSAGW